MSADDSRPSTGRITWGVRALLVALLVIGLLPLGSAALTGPGTDDASSRQPVVQSDGASGSASASGSSSGSGSSATAQDGDDGNVTRLYLDPRHEHFELKPGESETVEVTLTNDDDESVSLAPEVVRSPRRQHAIEPGWVTVEGGSATLAPGEEQTVNVTVSVPEGAELARYGGQVAFTDETVQYGPRPPEHVHALDFHVEVYKEPTVFLRSGRHMHAQVQAGDSYTHSIRIENTGDEAVPLAPEVETEDRGRCYGSHCPTTLQRSWLTIDAPNRIPAGETATVEVTVDPPADADRGRYSTELNLGIDDPTRPEEDRYWQRVGLDFQVWKQPSEPFETDFEVRPGDERVTVELSASDYHREQTETPPASFDVEFVAPDGSTVEAERVSTVKKGHVDLSGRAEGTSSDEPYETADGARTVTYRVPSDAVQPGDWTLRVMPDNAVRFGYEIDRTTAE